MLVWHNMMGLVTGDESRKRNSIWQILTSVLFNADKLLKQGILS